ncbi:hypothetical protein [Moritella sp.]|uniref:hypothetical protein n=1 Tax=Moritella sp. TaxID=78556 RepID=UPI001DA1AE5E|nr:hypothetical protein [Moritella sp.]MCJ8349011.1 hypothetical protein [Moritella sp.]NQZ41386.1 hypothetical protein [Moritella sp.]
MKLDLIIDTVEHAVDMKTGLETLAGVSETVRSIVEAALTDSVSQRTLSTNKVRNKMMESFEGSYGIVFEIQIEDQDLKLKMDQIGNQAMGEVINYFISEGLYRELPELTPKAKIALNNMSEETQEKLLTRLRRSPLEKAHSVSSTFGYDVKLRRHVNEFKRREIVKLDRQGKTNLTPTMNSNSLFIRACITRLNINTGNGRLLLDGETDTVAFGFIARYKEVKFASKTVFSENLNHNNGTTSDKWEYIDIKATTLRLKSGHIIKYLITGFE